MLQKSEDVGLVASSQEAPRGGRLANTAEGHHVDTRGKGDMMLAAGKSQQAPLAISNFCHKVSVERQLRQDSIPRRGSRSPSTSSSSRSSSSSSSSQSSCSSGSCTRRRSRRGRSMSSSSSEWSRSRSRPRPRCHRSRSRLRCGRCRHHSPPRHYRAHSRSYGRTPSPPRRLRRRCPSRSGSCGRRFYGFIGGSSRFISSPYRRTRSRSRSPIGANVRLSVEEKRELLRIAQANAVKALGMESLQLPASVQPILQPQEPARPEWAAPSSPQQMEADDVPVSKASTRSKNTVAKPTTSRSPGRPESTANKAEPASGHSPYGLWVPTKARSFPLLTDKHLPFKRR